MAKLFALIALSCELVLTACVIHVIRDYGFFVSGFVTAEDGATLQDVEVILQTDTPVYEALTPVKSQRLVTSNGTFMFGFLSHNSGTKYTITFRKEGFESQTVSGSSPPEGRHTIRLKRVESKSASEK